MTKFFKFTFNKKIFEEFEEFFSKIVLKQT